MTTSLINASCVGIGGRALLIAGEPGSGKSSLALALIDRGAVLVGDDGVSLERAGDRVLASPPPNIAGLIEIRNVGLVTLPTASAPLALRITLDRAAPRLPERAERIAICGCAVPTLALHPDSPVLALRAEWALAQHGLE